MTPLRIALASALSLALVLGGSPRQASAAEIAAANTSAGWPQQTSDIKADPRILFGRLPNGMRYALMHNTTPSGQASLRLRFDVGSLMESDAQQGLAHFLEHMAFNGSNHVPTGEMIKILERHGLAFGADTNASTDWNETVYKLDLPKTDDDTLDTSLMLLREVASELTIAQPAMDKERGVVLSEERLRDNPDYRAYRAELQAMLPDQLASRRMPIGQVEVIQSAKRDAIKDIYDKYYRPERAVLIAVGDFDVDAMEARIKPRFGDWRNTRPAGPEPVLGSPRPRPLQSAIAVQPGVQTALQIDWIQPPDLEPDTFAKRRRDMVERLALSVLNRRLSHIARTDSPPFLSAGAFEGDEFHSAEVTSLQVTPNGADWKTAIAAAVREQKRLVQYGVLQSELDREIQELRVEAKDRANGQSTRRTPTLANEIAASLVDKAVVTDPAQDAAIFDRIVQGLTVAEVDAAGRKAFAGQGPLVFLATPTAPEGGEAALTQAFQAAESAPVSAPTVQADVTWPYETFGAPGAVVERREVADLGVTFVRFANGVRLTVKPTAFRKDQVLVQARIGNGRLDLPKDRPSPAWARSSFIESGLKKVTAEELDKIMTSKIVGAAFAMDDDAFVLAGDTRASDLPVQMQILAAYLTDPGFRPEAFARTRTYALTMRDQLDATPNGVMGRELPLLLHSGDPRWAFPKNAEIGGTTLEDFKAMLAPALAEGRIEVLVVGDATVDQAIAAVASTFGALPARLAPEPPADSRKIAFPAPAPEPVTLTHKGRADQAVAVAAWPTTDLFADVQETRTLRVMVNVMQLRLIDTLRVAQGATYSPSAGLQADENYPGYGLVSASVEIPPAKIAGFYDQVAKIAQDLRTQDITADELKRAVLPRIDALGKAMQTNEFWLSSLGGAQTDPRRLALIASQIPQLQKVTPADVRAAAQKWLDPAREWKFQVLPAAAN